MNYSKITFIFLIIGGILFWSSPVFGQERSDLKGLLGQIHVLLNQIAASLYKLEVSAVTSVTAGTEESPTAVQPVPQPTPTQPSQSVQPPPALSSDSSTPVEPSSLATLEIPQRPYFKDQDEVELGETGDKVVNLQSSNSNLNCTTLRKSKMWRRYSHTASVCISSTPYVQTIYQRDQNRTFRASSSQTFVQRVRRAVEHEKILDYERGCPQCG